MSELKGNYMEPEVEAICFETEDVITTSGNGLDDAGEDDDE